MESPSAVILEKFLFRSPENKLNTLELVDSELMAPCTWLITLSISLPFKKFTLLFWHTFFTFLGLHIFKALHHPLQLHEKRRGKLKYLCVSKTLSNYVAFPNTFFVSFLPVSLAAWLLFFFFSSFIKYWLNTLYKIVLVSKHTYMKKT